LIARVLEPARRDSFAFDVSNDAGSDAAQNRAFIVTFSTRLTVDLEYQVSAKMFRLKELCRG
jgi:hypothetical protein